jgi:hypothetical protein
MIFKRSYIGAVHTLAVLNFSVILSEASHKKDSATTVKTEISETEKSSQSTSKLNSTSVVGSNFPALISNLSSNVLLDLQAHDDSLQSDTTPKVARHIGSKSPRREKLVLGMLKMKRPLFRAKIGDRPGIHVIRKIKGKMMVPQQGEVTRYAPRSLDMGLGGLMNYNPMENYYGPQPPTLLPTSGAPNSLDHLYLPEMTAKDYMKPLELNGLGNFPTGHEISNSIPYADGFGYQDPSGLKSHPVASNSGFRGNQIDSNYHHEIGRGGTSIGSAGHGPRGHERFHGPPVGSPGGEFHHHHHHHQPSRGDKMSHGTRHNHHHSQPDGPHPPPNPHENESKRGPPSSNTKFPRREEGSDRPRYQDDSHPEKPPPPPPLPSGNPGSAELQGDDGLWGIIDLAHMLQNSDGLAQQLSSVNSLSAAGGQDDGPESGPRGPHSHFDAPSPGGPSRGGGGERRGPKYSHHDGPPGPNEDDGQEGSHDGFGNFGGPPEPQNGGEHARGSGRGHKQPFRNPSSHGGGKYSKPNQLDDSPGPGTGPHIDEPGPDRGHFNEFDGPPTRHVGENGGRGKPNQFENYEAPGGYDDGPEPGDGPGGNRGQGHGPNKGGENGLNNAPNHDRYPGRGNGPRNSNHNPFEEPVPNLDGNPGTDGSPHPPNQGNGEGGEFGGYPGPQNAQGERYRDGQYDGYNDYGPGPTSRPQNVPTKAPYHGHLGGGFDEDGGEFNSQEQFDGPRRPDHNSDPGRGQGGLDGESPSDEPYYNGYD